MNENMAMKKETLKNLASIKLNETINDFSSFLNDMIDGGYLEEEQVNNLTERDMFISLYDRYTRLKELKQEEVKRHNPF